MTQLEIIDVPISYLVLVLIAAGARFMLTKKEPPTLKLLAASTIWGLFIVISTHGLVVSWATNAETGKTNTGLVALITALSSFCAKDILETIDKLWEQVKNDPLGLLREFLNKIRPSKGDDK